MNIAILSRGPGLYSTQSLLIAGQRRGHRMFLIDYMDCSIGLERNRPMVYYKEEAINYLHAIIPRIGASGTQHGSAVVQQFEMMGVYSVLSADALLKARNKLRSLQLLSKSGIRFPRTVFGNFHEHADYLVESVGGIPVIIKLLSGTHGLGVILAEDERTAESIIEAFQKLKEGIIVQEYIQEAGGEDIRAFVIGEEIVASMKRKALPGEFRSNLHRGGSASKINLTAAEVFTAKEAVRILGLKVAGVDMLQSHRGPLLIEVNPSPGLEGIEETTGIDIAGQVIALIEKEAVKNKV
ncbi:MAG: RimK family alpha-L-glutamate ligase [Bacteroidota bacterium]